MVSRIRTYMVPINWMALILCLFVTGDRVNDLVFEVPDIASSLDASSEEPDNAAEHVLMPSERSDDSAGITASPAADIDSGAIVLAVTVSPTLRTVPSLDHPPRNRPVSFSVPLRI